jgi:hypothetical protein
MDSIKARSHPPELVKSCWPKRMCGRAKLRLTFGPESTHLGSHTPSCTWRAASPQLSGMSSRRMYEMSDTQLQATRLLAICQTTARLDPQLLVLSSTTTTTPTATGRRTRCSRPSQTPASAPTPWSTSRNSRRRVCGWRTNSLPRSSSAYPSGRSSRSFLRSDRDRLGHSRDASR